MNMELHSTGASFVAAKEHNNPRDLVLETIKKGPSLTRKERFDDFRALLKENVEGYQSAVDWYFFVNMHDYFTTNRSRPQAAAQRAHAKDQQAQLVERIKAQIVLLDLTMPNGKPMKDCTGAEMARFGNRYHKIAQEVGRNKLVGVVLSEDQVKAIMK